jgi:hypothetical protein
LEPSILVLVLSPLWRTVLVYSNGAIMTEPIFDREKLDVDRLSIE